jgi:hypothetical protein
LLVSLASCARGSPVEFINGRLITHTNALPAVPTLTQLRLVPAATAAPVVAVAANAGGTTGRGREDEGYDPNPSYNFGYSIADTLTGDSKTREESRDGDVVRGSYSVADPDGRIRTVTYTADAVHGFQAKVTYDGAEGPVAIPFNAPSAAAPAAVSAVAAIDTEEDTVIAARVPATTATAARQSINASRLIPLRTVAAAPASAIHAVHTAAVPTVIRTAAPAAVHAVHHAAVPTVIRTAGPATAVHAVHTAAAPVFHAAAPAVVSTVRQVPEAVHAVHTLHHDDFAGPVTVVRQNAAVPAISSNQSLRALLANSGLDLSQFRFVSPVSIIN